MNTKSKEALFVANALTRAGVTPWIVDLSLKTHNVDGADMTGASVAARPELISICYSEISLKSFFP